MDADKIKTEDRTIRHQGIVEPGAGGRTTFLELVKRRCNFEA